jgi:thiamine transport system substrate-binding protein
MNHAYVRAAAVALAAISVAGCSLTSSGQDSDRGTEPTGRTQTGGTVVLATHESFALPKKLIRQFEAETGYTLEVRAAGDAGTLATKLSLTADNPIADAAFGIDNTFASRPLGEGAFAEFEPATRVPTGSSRSTPQACASTSTRRGSRPSRSTRRRPWPT